LKRKRASRSHSGSDETPTTTSNGPATRPRPSKRPRRLPSGDVTPKGNRRNQNRSPLPVQSRPRSLCSLVIDPLNALFRKLTLSKPKVNFDELIPLHLQDTTRVAILDLIREPLSTSEESGHVYCFKIFSLRIDSIDVKVGRTNCPQRRREEWRRYHPGQRRTYMRCFPVPESRRRNPFTHRLESLIGLELGDLETSRYVMDGDLRETTDVGRDSQWEREARKKDRCDCGKVHRELYRIPTSKTGPFAGRELEEVVIPIVEKWERFVADFYAV